MCGVHTKIHGVRTHGIYSHVGSRFAYTLFCTVENGQTRIIAYCRSLNQPFKSAMVHGHCLLANVLFSACRIFVGHTNLINGLALVQRSRGREAEWASDRKIERVRERNTGSAQYIDWPHSQRCYPKYTELYIYIFICPSLYYLFGGWWWMRWLWKYHCDSIIWLNATHTSYPTILRLSCTYNIWVREWLSIGLSGGSGQCSSTKTTFSIPGAF